jgi:hypothetical protein
MQSIPLSGSCLKFGFVRTTSCCHQWPKLQIQCGPTTRCDNVFGGFSMSLSPYQKAVMVRRSDTCMDKKSGL